MFGDKLKIAISEPLAKPDTNNNRNVNTRHSITDKLGALKCTSEKTNGNIVLSNFLKTVKHYLVVTKELFLSTSHLPTL